MPQQKKQQYKRIRELNSECLVLDKNHTQSKKSN